MVFRTGDLAVHDSTEARRPTATKGQNTVAVSDVRPFNPSLPEPVGLDYLGLAGLGRGGPSSRLPVGLKSCWLHAGISVWQKTLTTESLMQAGWPCSAAAKGVISSTPLPAYSRYAHRPGRRHPAR